MSCGVWEPPWLTHCRIPVKTCVEWAWTAARSVKIIQMEKCHMVCPQFLILFFFGASPDRFQLNVFPSLPVLRYFTALTPTSSGSRGTSACMSSTCLTRIRPAELWTWPDIPSTTCSNTSAVWTPTNATNWLTGGFGMEMTGLSDQAVCGVLKSIKSDWFSEK